MVEKVEESVLIGKFRLKLCTQEPRFVIAGRRD